MASVVYQIDVAGDNLNVPEFSTMDCGSGITDILAEPAIGTKHIAAPRAMSLRKHGIFIGKMVNLMFDVQI